MFAPIASYERYLFPSTNRKMDHHDDEYHAGGELHNKPSDEEAVARLEEIKKSIEGKMALRQSNLNSERPDLDKSSIEHVLRQLRKLPWSDCESYLLKCFMKVQKGKYGHIHLLASLTTGLRRYRDEFAVAVVDEVLEEIRLGLELNDYVDAAEAHCSYAFLRTAIQL
ncbi:hypothetical protein Dsin_004208 [Dipteronia sinensis]|uniref:MIF4G domain-containing protein n=1 Tax=Dipteronia sinensis TaxID=43782 RepID=A0AAE0ELN3_9ROSI|nr:hypothetical protein Dsin_004208 [Dipteronia sinensis]